jgi:hypothetical protein
MLFTFGYSCYAEELSGTLHSLEEINETKDKRCKLCLRWNMTDESMFVFLLGIVDRQIRSWNLSHVTNNLIMISDRTIGIGFTTFIMPPKFHFLSCRDNHK